MTHTSRASARACSSSRARPRRWRMAAEGRSGLLIDWGGVMTSNLMASFAAFCEAEGLDPGALAGIFRGNPDARELLFGFEEGRIEERAFELGLAEVLGVAE